MSRSIATFVNVRRHKRSGRSLSVALALAGSLVASAPAAAAVVTTTASCNVPLTGIYPVEFTTDYAIPATWPSGFAQQVPVSTTLTLPEELQEILRDQFGVTTVEPKQIRFTTLLDPAVGPTQPGAVVSGPVVPLPDEPSEALKLTATGGLPLLKAPAYDGPMTFKLQSPIAFGVIFRDAAGKEVRLFDDSGYNPDIDRYFTEVSCKFSASPALIGSTTVVAPTPEPLDFFGNTRTARSITMNWYPPESHVANTRYAVTLRNLSGPFYNETVTQTTTGTSATFGGLAPDRFYGFTIRAQTTSGSSAESAEYVATTASLSAPPSPPTGLRATNVTDRSLQLSWDAAADDQGAVVGYDVYQDGVKLDRVGSLTRTMTGLRAGQTYRFKVVAIDDSGNETASEELSVKTDLGTPLLWNFQTSGRAALPKLVTDSFTIFGTLNEENYPVAGVVTGNMTILERTVSLRSTGGIPVQGRIAFVPVGKFEGTNVATTQTLRQKLRVKIPEAKVLGVPVANLANCQTRAATIATFTSTGKILVSGGNLVGTFSLSDFTGCSSLSGLVDLSSSTGNSIALTLTAG